MRVRIAAPLGISLVMFILSWLSIHLGHGGYVWLLFFGAGAVLGGAGLFFAAGERH